MPKVEANTTENTGSVRDFIKSVPDQLRQKVALSMNVRIVNIEII